MEAIQFPSSLIYQVEELSKSVYINYAKFDFLALQH